MTIDEVDFIERELDSPAFMFLRNSNGGGISIEVDIMQHGNLNFSVSIEDARRLGERLIRAADDVAVGL